MIVFRRREPPGPCPICGAPHSTCTRYSGAPAVVQLPLRDAATALNVSSAAQLRAAGAEPAPPPLPGGAFTTGSYRRSQHGRRARR